MLLYHHSHELPIEELYDVHQDVLDEKPMGLWLAKGRDWIKYMEFEPVYSYKVELKSDTYEENNLLVFDFADMDNIMKLLKKYHARYRKGMNKYLSRKLWKYRVDWSLVQEAGYAGAAFVNTGKGEFHWLMLKDAEVGRGLIWIATFDIDSVCLWYPIDVVKKITEIKA